MTATMQQQQELRAQLMDAGLPDEWCYGLCNRTHNDWRFFKVVRNADDPAVPSHCSAPLLVFINAAGRTVLISCESAQSEIVRRKKPDAERIEDVWGQITRLMDRVEGIYS